MNTLKPIHGEPVPEYSKRGMSPVPPVECGFKLGDLVTYTNDAGLKIPGKRIVGFGHTINGMALSSSGKGPGLVNHFIHLNTGAWWFPHRPDELTLETPALPNN